MCGLACESLCYQKMFCILQNENSCVVVSRGKHLDIVCAIRCPMSNNKEVVCLFVHLISTHKYAVPYGNNVISNVCVPIYMFKV